MSRNLIQAVVVLFVATLVVAVRAQSQPGAERPHQPAAAPVQGAAQNAAPLVQLAILLDNSGSMSGLNAEEGRRWSPTVLDELRQQVLERHCRGKENR